MSNKSLIKSKRSNNKCSKLHWTTSFLKNWRFKKINSQEKSYAQGSCTTRTNLPMLTHWRRFTTSSTWRAIRVMKQFSWQRITCMRLSNASIRKKSSLITAVTTYSRLSLTRENILKTADLSSSTDSKSLWRRAATNTTQIWSTVYSWWE